ncbi:MAG: radical SAM protein [Candidatus Rokubacteria bacterium]|nr:radical SAM protein [Candidatus Rokubacteria bacterium]
MALLLQVGLFPYYYTRRQKPRGTIEGRAVTQCETVYQVKWRRERWEGVAAVRAARYAEREDAFWVPIREISRVWYEGPVYNLEVADDDHSYTVGGVAVGNCQNFDVSQKGEGAVVSPERLAAMMLELQARGCHNINFVTPEHVVPHILEALPLAIRGGLRLPIVYNTSAYDSLESLRWMDGIVDVYMPDFKVWDGAVAKRYLKAPDYPEAARAAIREMHRQVGPLVMDEHGLARRGVLVRHLVMPGLLEETRQIMGWLARELSPDTYVNVMAQYYPAGAVSAEKYPEINRKLCREEHAAAVRVAREAGLWRLDQRRARLRPLWG